MCPSDVLNFKIGSEAILEYENQKLLSRLKQCWATNDKRQCLVITYLKSTILWDITAGTLKFLQSGNGIEISDFDGVSDRQTMNYKIWDELLKNIILPIEIVENLNLVIYLNEPVYKINLKQIQTTYQN